MPGDARGVLRKALRENWKSQPRAGKGGGREYAFNALPKETQQHLIRQAVGRVPETTPEPALPAVTDGQTAPVAETTASVPATVTTADERPLQACGDLKSWQRQRMVARLAILMEIDRLAGVMGVDKAVRIVCEQAALGQLAPELQRHVPVANARSGADGQRTLSRRTLYRWLADRERGNAALAPLPMERKTVPAWLPALLDLYQRPTKPSLTWAVEQLAGRLPEGVDPPSYWAARRYLEKLPEIERERGRMGPRDLRNLQPFRRRDTSQLWPGDIYTMDGHTFDAEVTHPLHGRPFRPEITGCVDIATRRIVGWSIALAESGWAVLDALRHACCAHGIPAILYVDNGSGYCNALMDDAATGLLTRLSITKQTSIPYNSQARGLMERNHQSVWVRLAKELPTYMGADMDKEARQKAFKLTRKQIKETGASTILITWHAFSGKAQSAVDAYNARPHRGLPKIRDDQTGKLRHQSPDEAWAAAVAEGWEPMPVDGAEADDLFRPYQVRKTVRGEVSLFGNTYFSQVLADYTGEVVRVGYDIHDASRVWIRDRNDRLLCVARFEANKSSYFPVTAIEDAAARRAKGRQQRAERVLDEIAAEHQGILGAIPQPAAVSDEERVAADAMLARLDQLQAEQCAAERADAQARRAAAEQQLAALPAPEVTPAPQAERPEFSTDFALWLWVEDHPEAATEQDRAYLAQALAESPALRIQVDAERAKRARRG